MKRSKKQLIIGQGLAGSLLAMEMWEMGVEFKIVSAELPYSASRVAAGILNPITGKRLALTWRYGEFYEFAANRYATLEKVLESDFFEKMPLLRFFQNEQEIRIFEKKMNMPEYRNWLGDRNPPGCLGPSVKDDLGSFNILCAAALDTKQFVKQSARWLKNRNLFCEEKFSHMDLKRTPEGVVWKNESFERVIFCEGYRIRDNPWFSSIPLELAAGEIQTLRLQEALPNGILNAGKWLRPKQDGRYLAGATYSWDNLEKPPNDGSLREMKTGLGKLLVNSPTLLKRDTGIRPVTKDRKPVLGLHPKYSSLAVFNGLGSKGSLMAPFLAKHLAEALLIPARMVEPDIDVGRFSKFFV